MNRNQWIEINEWNLNDFGNSPSSAKIMGSRVRFFWAALTSYIVECWPRHRLCGKLTMKTSPSREFTSASVHFECTLRASAIDRLVPTAKLRSAHTTVDTDWYNWTIILQKWCFFLRTPARIFPSHRPTPLPTAAVRAFTHSASLQTCARATKVVMAS